MGTTLRKELFWFIDRLRGSRIKNKLLDVQRINEQPYSNYAIAAKSNYLDSILGHCLNTVPFYQALDLSKAQLEQFPVIDKNIIRNNFQAFLSEDYRNKKVYKASTSGSTGTPFTVYQDRDKRRRNTADTLYFAKKAGFEVGTPLFFMRIWQKTGLMSRVKLLLQNVHLVNVTQLDEARIKKLLKKLSRGSKQKSILAYSSAFETLCMYLDKKQPNFSINKIQSIISMSEALDQHTKEALLKYFNCHVFSRYSNRENGILTQQVPGFGDNYLLNQASYNFELLRIDSDGPAEFGELGRIVVTDYFNYAMPLIRYDTGDIGVMETQQHHGDSFIVFSKIEGRIMDTVYNTSGALISSFVFPNKLRKYTEINQFQFIQTGAASYRFELNISKNFNAEEELIKEFKGVLGKDAVIETHYIDEIPLLSSGKRKKVLNTFHSA